MSNGTATSPFAEAGRLVSRATLLLQLLPGGGTRGTGGEPATAWATGFFFTDTLAMTAAHNLALHHRGTTVRAIYKERFLTLEWRRAWSDLAADVAVLRLQQRPAGVEIESVPV